MAESLCAHTHMCMKQPDCPDSHCQGRWERPQLHLREGSLRQHEGAHTIHFRPVAPAPRRVRVRIPAKAWAFIGAVSGALAAAWVIARFPA